MRALCLAKPALAGCVRASVAHGTGRLVRRVLMAVAACAMLSVAMPAAADEGAAPSVQYHIVDRIAGRDGGWDFATVDPVHGRLFVARSDAIERVDLATRAVTDQLAPARRAHQVLVIDGGATLFETDGETGLARFIAADSGQVLAELPSGAKPDAALFDPVTGLIAVMNAGDGTIALFDPVKRSAAGRIAVGGALEYGVADGRGGAFVNIEDANAIARIDLKGKRRIGTIALPGCDGPTGLALVSGGTRLIAACANGVALVLDATSGRTITTLNIGADPDAVLVDAARGLAFIPCGGTGTLIAISIADADHIAVVGVIPTQRGAKTGAIDPRDGRIYLPAATLAPAEPGAKRGKPLPGSFTVLILAPVQKGVQALQYLNPAQFDPMRILPAPPARGSVDETLEIQRIRTLGVAMDAARKAQAKQDGDVEDPSIFNAVAGRDLRSLPNTWALLTLVQSETDIVVNAGKNGFNRTRPWGIDPALASCEQTMHKLPARSYPSGHAGLGYSVGWTLAQLMPDRAASILARSRDYAISREICGAHFASDTEASHALGTLTASSLFNDSRLSGLIEAARAELNQH